ncbi:TetR/AcrR family transcriptional regulator [Neptunicella sp. SCSIO 80796]|uniref:TetR/AcrR family transcriptional regulator n=1 Tax=Neptunicella plasticusilytica TaxID=3117012 RepID=UPI003A4DA468
MAHPSSKRELILDIAEQGVLNKGFSATSIDEIIAEAAISKNGFFYHFKDKNELARAMLQRYLDNEEAVLDQVFSRGRELYADPLDAFLAGLKLLAKLMSDLPNGHPGCLVATVAYSEKLYDRQVRELNRQAILTWRKRFLASLNEIAAKHPPRQDVELRIVADMISGTIEGGIILSRALNEPAVLAEQILSLHTYIKLLFMPQGTEGCA